MRFSPLRHGTVFALALCFCALAQTPAAPAPAPAAKAAPALIPRDILFGNPERASPRLSPDGQRLAWLAPDGWPSPTCCTRTRDTVSQGRRTASTSSCAPGSFCRSTWGGRAEPLPGDKIPGSTGVVKVVEAKPGQQAAR